MRGPPEISGASSFFSVLQIAECLQHYNFVLEFKKWFMVVERKFLWFLLAVIGTTHTDDNLLFQMDFF